MDDITKTWAWLVALIVATTLLAGIEGTGFAGKMAVVGILGLAFLKARLILGRFLHLAAAPGWLSAFAVPVGIWLLLIAAGLVLVAG